MLLSKGNMTISPTELKTAGIHFGNLTRKWNPHMQPYVYQRSQKIYILDWHKIIASCRKLDDYIKELVAQGKKILFLATKKSTREMVTEQARRCGMPFIVNKW
jgi:small subunit ribosomal protein S2